MELKKSTRWLQRPQSGGETPPAKKAGKGGAVVTVSLSRGEFSAASLQFKVGARQVLELRKNTAKIIGSAISKPISDTRRAKTKELADRARAAQDSPVTARFQR